MVQAPPRTVFNPQGTEHNDSIVSVAPQLPLYIEVRTDILTTYLQLVYNFTARTLVNNWLKPRQKTGFYFEISNHLHIGFADQRDGAGSQYWWFIYYDSVEKTRIVNNIKIQQHLVSTRLERNRVIEDLLWNGLTFKSHAEIKIARALSSQNLTFFANVNGFIGLNGLPISNQNNQMREKTEVDFLVFYNQKCMILEVDGVHHDQKFQRNWDCKRDRIFLRQGISTVRFSAEQCHENATAVVEEFLALFN